MNDSETSRILSEAVFLTLLSLHCCAGFSLVAESGGYSLAVAWGPLIAVASLVVKHRLSGARASIVTSHRLLRCGSWAPEQRLSSYGTQT